MSIKSGDTLTRGAGVAQAWRAQLQRLALLNRGVGLDVMSAALHVRDRRAWEFMAWLALVEERARDDVLHGGIPRSGEGKGDGIPLSAAQRLDIEVPLLLKRMARAIDCLLRRLAEEPSQTLKVLDKQCRLW
jgi:hypothetical protein